MSAEQAKADPPRVAHEPGATRPSLRAYHTPEHKRRRFRRHRRRAYIRSVYSLPSLATLGNAVCGFGAIYVASLGPTISSPDRITVFFSEHSFAAAAYLIFLAMLFDAVDGRLARFTRHTTDFGGQLDSLADVISFGAAPAFVALALFRSTVEVYEPDLPLFVSRLIWAIGALYMSCAAIRLARFNVSNEHGEQHHFSFLGLPSPGAGATVAGLILMQQELTQDGLQNLALACAWALPVVVLATGLLMVSGIRYPHIVNRYLRGRQSFAWLLLVFAGLLALFVAHEYTVGIASLVYAAYGPVNSMHLRIRHRGSPLASAASP